VLVTGDGANSLAKQCGGWSVTWQGIGNPNSDFPGATTIYEGIRERVTAAGGRATLSESGDFETRPDVAIVVFGEDPYAEMQGDVRNLQYKPGDERDLELLKRLRAQGIPVVALFITGRPLWINRELNQSDAFVVIWQPGTEGAGVADVIFAADDGGITHDMRGRLAFSWPKRPDQGPLNHGDERYDPLFPYGYGLAYGERDLLGDHLPEEGIAEAYSSAVLELFYRRPMAPWEFVLEGNVNDRESMTGNHAAVSTVSAQSVDREVQEDARRVVWNGLGMGAVSLAAAAPQDLTPYLAANARLIVEIKVERAPTAPLALRVACGPSCASDIDVTERLGALAGQGWQTLTFALGEFPDAGSNFGLVLTPRQFFDRVTAPFCLVTAGELDVTLGRVMIAKPEAL
jgi:beta-glucosidase